MRASKNYGSLLGCLLERSNGCTYAFTYMCMHASVHMYARVYMHVCMHDNACLYPVSFGFVWFCMVMSVCMSTYEGKCREGEGPFILRHEHNFVTLLSSWKMAVENLAPRQTWPLLL